VIYNVALRGRTAFLSGLFLSLLRTWRGTGWWEAFTGYTLVFLLLQISASGSRWCGRGSALRVSPLGRRLVGLAFVGLPIAEWRASCAAARAHGSRFFGASLSLSVIGAPARPFLATTAARPHSRGSSLRPLPWRSSPRWSRTSAGSRCLREAAIRHSERRALPSRACAAAAARSGRVRRRCAACRCSVPRGRRSGGVAPDPGAGAQPARVLMLLSIIGLVSAAAILIPYLRGGDPDLTVRMGRTGSSWSPSCPLLMGDNLACDFRRDLDRMGQLKSWPISSLALAAGQIAPAAAFATTVQVMGVVALVITTSAITPGIALLVLGLMPS